MLICEYSKSTDAQGGLRNEWITVKQYIIDQPN